MRNAKSIKTYRSFSDYIFKGLIWLFLIIMMLAILIPVLHVIASSLSDVKAVKAGKVFIWPVDFSLESYKVVFNTPTLMRALLNSIAYTVGYIIVAVSLTLLAGYPLSRKDLRGRSMVMALYTFTMFFGGGMIPTYIVVSKLGLVDSYWGVILPGAVGVWNVILVKTYIQTSIPEEIFESASLDGCSDWKYFLHMVLPLSKSIVAVMVLLYGVIKWNDFMSGLLYINTPEKQTFQYVLRSILIVNDGSVLSLAEELKRQETKDLLQYSLIMVSTIPIMALYPFVQKHFVKGVLMGSIKG